MGSASWFSLLFGVTLLTACGAEPERHGPAGDAQRSLPELSVTDADPTQPGPRSAELERNEGVLELTARSALQRQLDSIRYVVKNAAGEVVAGGADEAASGGAQDRELSLVLVAGEGMKLELSATTADASLCTASVGPFRIEAGSKASFQVFVWRCDGAPGAAAPEPECYWLADWIGVTRTRAAVGDWIGLSAAGHDARGEPARFKWSTPSPEQGRFDDADAAETSFRCAASAVALPLGLAMSDGQCHKAFSALVACQ